MFTVEMLADLLKENGFKIDAVDNQIGWVAVGVEIDDYRSAAVEIWRMQLCVWYVEENAHAEVMVRAELADPNCFETMLTALESLVN